MSNIHPVAKNNKARVKSSYQKSILVPAMNMEEEDDRYILTIALPGLKREDIAVKVKGGRITVRTLSRKKEEPSYCTGSIHNHHEYDFSHSHRTIKPPVNADIVMMQAYYENGELRMVIPKTVTAEEQSGTKPINIAIY